MTKPAQPQSKLLLIPGTGDSPDLCERVMHHLQETYNMGPAVEMIRPLLGKDVEKGLKKAHTYPLVCDSFNDDETRVDLGRNVLQDRIRGTHVAMIKLMYTPKRRPDMSINDHCVEVCGLLDVISNTDTLQRTLAMPYFPYLRSHSVDAYKKQGFFQFDSLEFWVKLWHDIGLNNMISIDPHSEKIKEVAAKFGMTTGMANPFESSVFTNPGKLGLSEDDGRQVMRKLQPFLEHYRAIKDQDEYNGRKIYFLSPDGSAELRVERFSRYAQLFIDDVPPEESTWGNMGYRDKKRASIEGATAVFKKFSKVQRDNIDPDGVYVIIDDMLSSGGTAEKLAKDLKKSGAQRVELWCSHAVAPDREAVKSLEYLDKINVLDTVLHNNPDELKLHYINAAEHLIAAELYKTHMRLEEDRFTV